MKNTLFGSMLVAIALLSVSKAYSAEYEIDKAHSRIAFSIRHMMISEVTGNFRDFDGSFTFDPDKGTVSNAVFTAQAASIDTDNDKRNEHLRSPDFFDVAKYPTLTIKNSKITKNGKDKFKWTGDLTMHGVTKPVTFELEYKGSIMDPMAKVHRAGFHAEGKINRKDFGLTWNKNLDAGGVALGDDVKITMDAEALEKAPAAKK